MPSDIKTESTLFDRRTEFWRNYRIGRPAIPSSFYQRFYDYHATHGGSFGTVHDVGAGFGELSLELSKRFDHVIVSDPAPKSLDVARELIGAASSSFNKFSFRQERVEDCELPKASVDAIFCCNAIHWTDLDKAMAISTDQLKLHGTLFICLNGIPKYDSAVQPSWWSMVDNCLADVKKRMPKADVERILAIQDNGYDCIALPESDFEPGAVRLKLNMMGDPAASVQAPESSKGGPHVSNVGPHDRLEEGVEEDWFFDVDIEGLRATVGSYPFDPDPDMLERHLSKLDTILAGGTCRGHWPVSILMATRRT